MNKITELVRFDWAIKRLLRNKANFVIVEGFLSVLLNQKIKIKKVLESEGNQETDVNKFNRVDILVENAASELVIIEIQNSNDYEYFQRMLYATSKAIAEYMDIGKPYSHIKKVISVNIVYFELGQGADYVYHGSTSFTGIHKHDELKLSEKQKTLYNKTSVRDIYPEYWVIKVNKFDDVAKDKLDEWVYFLKNARIKNEFTAQGLKEAKKELDILKLKEEDRRRYNNYLTNLMNIASENFNIQADYNFSLAEIKKEAEKKIGDAEKKAADAEKLLVAQQEKAAKLLLRNGISIVLISQATGLPIEQIEKMMPA